MKKCNIRVIQNFSGAEIRDFLFEVFRAGNMKGRLVFSNMILFNVMVFCQEEITFGILSKADFGKATLIC